MRPEQGATQQQQQQAPQVRQEAVAAGEAEHPLSLIHI